MKLAMRRIVLFTKNMPAMVAFHRDVLGLPLTADEWGWKEFDAGGCGIALHNGTSRIGARPPKIVFFPADVAATRETLAARGVKLGKIVRGGGVILCDGKDPDGNSFGLSNRA